MRKLLPTLAILLATCNLGCSAEPSPVANVMGEGNAREVPELDGGAAWLNAAGPVKLKDLKGKVVVIDFWTLCCINCIHVMPDLAKLEKKYPNELVVIGVHSPKFDNEKNSGSIKNAILRYELSHPVVNDAERKIWDRFGVNSWPTLLVIDPDGKEALRVSGEGHYDEMDRTIAALIEKAKKAKTLNDKPIRFDLVRFREKGDTPLFYPGKILADAPGKRLFISDSTHHRIVITDLDGKKLSIVGVGAPGYKNGSFNEAQFDDPQGLALDGETLYVADRKNHSIRALDLKAHTVSTAAGTGEQSYAARSEKVLLPAKTTGLSSPWDLLILGRNLYIAMAGDHQIWKLDLDQEKIGPFAGDGGENIRDGKLRSARFAQPSGLATDGEFLYVADSEVSSIRKISLKDEQVTTLVGEGLFEFGDKDGTGKEVRLQHALGLAFHKGQLIVADTYNSKLKSLDPDTKTCKTLFAGVKDAAFDEPSGLSFAGDKLFVADTNAHRIRVVDLTANTVKTLTLTGVDPVEMKKK